MSPTALIACKPAAVVVGVCAHGLAIVRALSRAGVEVHVVEANPRLPGASTRLARVHFVADINGPMLIERLTQVAVSLGGGGGDSRPVLILTNDNMVRVVAESWTELQTHYRLSWGHARGQVHRFVSKSELEAHCALVGLNYPKTYILGSEQGSEEAARVVGYPAIVKPSKPLSGFKTRVIQSRDDLDALVREFRRDLPFLVQKWIPGDDRSIYFCALYLDNGSILARFDGRKLRSWPMGHTTVAEPLVDNEVYEQTCRFFAPLRMSGPVSLELKRGPDGLLWVIEPTVGRTDFWLGLCVENGVNLPLIEYANQTGISIENPAQLARKTWLNTNRDPQALLWYLAMVAAGRVTARPVSLPFLHANDPRPFMRALWLFVVDLWSRATRRLRRWFVPDGRKDVENRGR